MLCLNSCIVIHQKQWTIIYVNLKSHIENRIYLGMALKSSEEKRNCKGWVSYIKLYCTYVAKIKVWTSIDTTDKAIP